MIFSIRGSRFGSKCHRGAIWWRNINRYNILENSTSPEIADLLKYIRVIQAFLSCKRIVRRVANAGGEFSLNGGVKLLSQIADKLGG